MSQSMVTLITGCSSGFGFVAAKDLAQRGHVVYASMRAVEGKNKESAEALRSFASEESLQLHVQDLDVQLNILAFMNPVHVPHRAHLSAHGAAVFMLGL